jgi:hypothetical protein
MNKIKFETILKKVGNKYKPSDKEIFLTREQIITLNKDLERKGVYGIVVYLGDKI